MPNENDNHGESRIIFEDYDWLIVNPLDYESYVYHAPENMKSRFGEFRDGYIYFIVDKNNNATYAGGFKTYMMYLDDDVTQYYNWNGKDIKNKKTFVEDFPDEIIKQINNILGNSELYELLVKIVSGRTVGPYEMKNSDDLITKFTYNESNPGKSLIRLTFYDTDDFFKIFNIDENDKWFVDRMFSSYGSYDFYDSHHAYEEWKQGYIIDGFNDENLQKFKEIVSLVAPQYSNLNDEDTKVKAAELMDEMFSEISDIYDDWVTEYNYCLNRGGVEWIQSDLCGIFSNYGLVEKECMKEYLTTARILLSLYNQVKDSTLTLTELLSELVKDKDIGGWDEHMFEVDCVDFDDDSFQTYVTNRLEKIYDRLEDDENFVNVSEYSRLYQGITSKYKIDTNYKTKYGKSFKIIKINPVDNKIHVAVDMGGGKGQERSYTEDEFNNFLVSPELFENKKIRKKTLTFK